jgi:hypothetical protein
MVASSTKKEAPISVSSFMTMVWISWLLAIGFGLGFLQFIATNPKCLEALSDAETEMGWKPPAMINL